jgi:hypothetical protein
MHESYLKSYVSYGLAIEQPAINAWVDLFDLTLLKHFIAWHAARVGVQRISHTGYKAAWLLVHLAGYEHHPKHAALKAWVQKLKTPEPMHNKQDAAHTINPRDLEDVGLTLLAEAKALTPGTNTKYPGKFAALAHQTGLIFRLLIRVPLRSRNIREMQLGRHLFQDGDGVWQLRFHGEDLKIRQRKGRINTFARPFPTDLIEHLEEFLQHYRPLLPNNTNYPHVFIAGSGKPLTSEALRLRLQYETYARLKKRFYPHLIRTIMTDSMLIKGVDVSTVAFLLNDTPEMIYKRYHELRANDHIKIADQFMASLLG